VLEIKINNFNKILGKIIYLFIFFLIFIIFCSKKNVFAMKKDSDSRLKKTIFINFLNFPNCFCIKQEKNKKIEEINSKFNSLEQNINNINSQIGKILDELNKLDDIKKKISLESENKVHLEENSKFQKDNSFDFEGYNKILSKIRKLKLSVEENEEIIKSDIIEKIYELELETDKKNNEEIKNLKNFYNFINEQKYYFEQQIKDLQKQIEKGDEKEIKIPIKFKDIIGMEFVKNELLEIKFFLDDDKTKTLINSDLLKPKGYLLYGPSGTGKTSLAMALSNECGEDVKFIYTTSAEFSRKYVGESEMAMTKLWEEAKLNKKTIIFIDEIDGLGNRKNYLAEEGGGSSAQLSREGVINILLKQLDSCPDSIVLIAATNHLNKLDKSLLNRLSKKIHVSLLKDEEIENFLKNVSLPYRISYSAFIYLKDLTERCKGRKYSQRELTDIIQGAYNKANRYNVENEKNKLPYRDHSYMLFSDLEEIIDLKQNISKSFEETTKVREICENEFFRNRYFSKNNNNLKILSSHKYSLKS
jgi:SpoVK/Ycf46/Vps4 family AAA+-type ATPase